MNQEITDASEFAQTSLPQLAQLDTLLRCHICKDFLKTPVLTPCGHTFCSLCIREYLTKEPKCPLCLNELRESSLRSDFLVNEIIESYKSSRKQLLEVLKKEAPKEATPLIDIQSDSDGDDDIQILSANKKPKATMLRSSCDSNRISKPSTKIGSIKSAQGKKPRKVEDMAQCPICQEFLPIEVLERSHLDECLTLQSLGKRTKQLKTAMIKAPSVSSKISDIFDRKQRSLTSSGNEISHVDRYLTSSNSADRKRLPKTNFTLMNNTQIRQKLSSLGLPTTGSKQNMITRYNHYEMLWNSNFCDAAIPVGENELKRQLISWEASHNSANSVNSNGNTISSLMKRTNNSQSYQKLLTNFKNDKFDRSSWITMFDKEFRYLVKEARKSIAAKSHGQEGSSQTRTQKITDGQ